MDYRSGELNSADLLELKLQLVRYPSETAANAGKPKEHSKRNTSLLVLAANNILRSLTAGKKGEAHEYFNCSLMETCSI